MASARSLSELPAVAGLVIDTTIEARIAWADIKLLGTTLGTQTGEDGFFRLTLPDSGTFDLEVWPPGYTKQVRRVRAGLRRTDTLRFHFGGRLVR